MMEQVIKRGEQCSWKLSQLFYQLTEPEQIYFVFNKIIESIQNKGLKEWIKECIIFKGQKDADVLMYAMRIIDSGLNSKDEAIKNIFKAIALTDKLIHDTFDLSLSLEQKSDYIYNQIIEYANVANFYNIEQWRIILYEFATKDSLTPDYEIIKSTHPNSNSTEVELTVAEMQNWQLAGWINPVEIKKWYSAGWRDAEEAKKWYPDFEPTIAFLLKYEHDIEIETAQSWVKAGWGPYILTAIEWLHYAGHTDFKKALQLALEGHNPYHSVFYDLPEEDRPWKVNIRSNRRVDW